MHCDNLSKKESIYFSVLNGKSNGKYKVLPNIYVYIFLCFFAHKSEGVRLNGRDASGGEKSSNLVGVMF